MLEVPALQRARSGTRSSLEEEVLAGPVHGRAVETGGDAPRYLDGYGVQLEASGFVFRDGTSGRRRMPCPAG